MLLKECLRDISLPESEFDDDMSFFRSLFPIEELIKESFIELKSRPHAPEKRHPWLMDQS